MKTIKYHVVVNFQNNDWLDPVWVEIVPTDGRPAHFDDRREAQKFLMSFEGIEGFEFDVMVVSV